MDPDLNTHRFALLCLLGIAGLMLLFTLFPLIFAPLGLLLLLPGAFLFSLYLSRLFRP